MKILKVGHYEVRNLGYEIILFSQLQMITRRFSANCMFYRYTYYKRITVNLHRSHGYSIETYKHLI